MSVLAKKDPGAMRPCFLRRSGWMKQLVIPAEGAAVRFGRADALAASKVARRRERWLTADASGLSDDQEPFFHVLGLPCPDMPALAPRRRTMGGFPAGSLLSGDLPGAWRVRGLRRCREFILSSAPDPLPERPPRAGPWECPGACRAFPGLKSADISR